MDIMETIREQVENNSVLLYMKGSPNQPQCGFSSRTVQALMGCGQRFAYVDTSLIFPYFVIIKDVIFKFLI